MTACEGHRACLMTVAGQIPMAARCLVPGHADGVSQDIGMAGPTAFSDVEAALIITAVAAEGLSQEEATRRYGVSQGWLSRLLARSRAEGHAGPHTIAGYLEHHHQTRVSAATASRYLTRAGLVTPEPAERPRSSYIQFARGRVLAVADVAQRTVADTTVGGLGRRPATLA